MPAAAAAESTTQHPAFAVFAPFTKVSKQPDGTLMVEAEINDETVDDQGEIVTYEAVEKASADYMAWAAVREMHNPQTAAGTMVSLTSDPALRKHVGIIHVVDADAVKKVESGVYKGTSLGGAKTSFGAMVKAAGGKLARLVDGIKWDETSLVDRPSRPTAKLTLLKRSDEPEAGEAAATDETAAEGSVQTPAAAAPDASASEATEAAAPAESEAPAAEAEAAAEPVEKAAKPADLTKAPAAGTDTYLGPDGKPIASTAAASTAAKLVKSAVDDLWSLTDIINQLATLIEREALEGDGPDVAKLKAIMVDLQAAAAAEAAEVGTPADTAQREEEIAEMAAPLTEIVVVGGSPMYYAAVIGDLAKSALALRKGALPADQVSQIQQLHDMAHAAGAQGVASEAVALQPLVGELAKVAGVDPDEFLAKVTQHITEAVGPIATASDLATMKAELLGALEPVKGELAKIAAQPVPGGPLRYAADDRRGILLTPGDPVGSSDLAEALSKVANATTDPHLREQLGRLAAAEEIAAARRQSA